MDDDEERCRVFRKTPEGFLEACVFFFFCQQWTGSQPVCEKHCRLCPGIEEPVHTTFPPRQPAREMAWAVLSMSSGPAVQCHPDRLWYAI